MFWSFSFQLLPEEEVIDDSTKHPESGIKSAYSVFLTNKRAIFRFDGLGSALTQSFFYHEIISVEQAKRLFVTYLHLKTSKRNFLLNVSNAEYWTKKILDLKHAQPDIREEKAQISTLSCDRKKRELLDMLTILRKNSLLNDSELEAKIHLLDTIKL